MILGQIPTTDLLTQLVVAVSVLLIGWYIVGAQIGRQKATRLAHLATRLLKPLGTEGSFRWLGSAGCEIRVSHVRRPFKTIQAVVWLEPREMLPVWLVNRWRGRRDLIAVAAELRDPPSVVFELVDPRSTVGRRALGKAAAHGWTSQPRQFESRPMLLAASDVGRAERAITAIASSAPLDEVRLLRLATSDVPPHLSLSIARPDALEKTGDAFATWLSLVADTVAPPT
jgi:hypothetical protein